MLNSVFSLIQSDKDMNSLGFYIAYQFLFYKDELQIYIIPDEEIVKYSLTFVKSY